MHTAVASLMYNLSIGGMVMDGVFLGRRRRPYIVFSFRLLYGFMFVTRIYIYIYRAINMAALEDTVLERLKSSLLLFRRL